MKTIKYFFSILAISATLTSCIGDLNVTPIDPNADTADKVLVDEASFTSFLAGVYTGFATSGYYAANGSPSISGLDGGASQYFRGLYNLNELTTDEAVNNWNDQTIKNFHWMNWTTSDVFIYAFYSRIFMQVSAANEFIREAKASSVTFPQKEEYIAEARVLRALAYYHAIDNFGNVPFADETSVVGAFPDQIQRADLFDWLEKELNDLIDNSALAAPRANGYARADKGVAKFLLAKLYLNAKVYTGTAMYDKCAQVLSSLMKDGYSLEIRPNVHSYYNAMVHFEDIDFIITTLWARIPLEEAYYTEQMVSDFRRILYNGELLTYTDFNREHERCLSFLKESVGLSNSQKKIVITHHVPSYRMQCPKFADSKANGAFLVELEDYIKESGIDYWIFGHSHYNVDVKVGKTKCISNQLGYVFHGEHGSFNPQKTIEL